MKTSAVPRAPDEGTPGVALPFLALLVIGVAFPRSAAAPLGGVIADRACACLRWCPAQPGGRLHWQIAIGWVALLTLGGFHTDERAGCWQRRFELSLYLALAMVAVVGAIFG